jgi:hypothetical protein
MDDTTFNQAADLLVNDPPIEGNVTNEPAPVVDTNVAPEPTMTPPTSSEEPFTRIDPSALPPELQAIYKQMQGDYTRKTQEVAAYRKLGADPDALARAYQFYQNMDTDPNYAKQVADYIYQQMGVNVQAPPQQNPNPFDPGTTNDLYGEQEDDFSENVPTAVQKQMAEMQAALEELRNERALAEMEKFVLSQEAQIRQVNPNYDQDDIDAIYQIASSMEVPDLLQAEERYTALQARWAQKMLTNKPGTPQAPVQPGNFAQTPQRPASLDEATQIGLNMILGQNGM